METHRGSPWRNKNSSHRRSLHGRKAFESTAPLFGQTPAVLYGHGEANVCLSVPSEALAAALRHGSRMVGLTGAVTESAFIRELQWDTYGTHVLHVDFTRISVDELVKVHVTVELRARRRA